MNAEHYDFDELNAAADITTLKGIPPLIRTTAKELHGPCPFGGPADHTGFWINFKEVPMTWSCRRKGESGCVPGCTGGGDAMQYIAIREHLNRKTSASEIHDIKQRIAEREHLDMEKDAQQINSIRWNNPEYRTEAEQIAAILAGEIGAAPSAGPLYSGSSSKREERQQARTPEQPAVEWQRVMIPLVDKFAEDLYNGSPESNAALYYLYDRGLTDLIIHKNKIGYVPFQDKYFGYKVDASTGNRVYKKDVPGYWIPEGITIPTFIKGNLFRVKVRMMEQRTIAKAAAKDLREPNTKHDPHDYRYSNVTGTEGKGGTALFNADAAAMTRPRADIVFVEGELDALLINSLIFESDYGYLQAVTFGSKSIHPPFETYYRYFRTPNRIAIVYDNDDSGREGAKLLQSEIMKLKTRETPPVKDEIPNQYKDFGDWYEAEGKGPIMKFLWNLFPLDTALYG